jgi:hypothetical protein
VQRSIKTTMTSLLGPFLGPFWLGLLVLAVGIGVCLAFKRSDLAINSCDFANVAFGDYQHPLHINAHCNQEVYAVSVKGDTLYQLDGLYEEYGKFGGIYRYERVFNNGTKVILRRHRLVTERYNFVWELTYKSSMLYVSFAIEDEKMPSSTAPWFLYVKDSLKPTELRVSKVHFKKHLAKTIQTSLSELNSNSTNTDYLPTSYDDRFSLSRVLAENLEIGDIQAQDLDTTLHPAVGPNLGRMLRNFYVGATPYPAIVIDNMFNGTVLRGAVAAVNSAQDTEWIGPETDPGCCKDKFRLSFASPAFRRDAWCAMLATVVADPKFIGFIEELTNVHGLVPLVNKDLAQTGSSIIGIRSGGFLYVHNDVSRLLCS